MYNDFFPIFHGYFCELKLLSFGIFLSFSDIFCSIKVWGFPTITLFFNLFFYLRKILFKIPY